VLYGTLSTGLVFVFHRKQKHLKNAFLERSTNLKGMISKNEKQLKRRNKALNTYNFLTYNLKESLLVQNIIQL